MLAGCSWWPFGKSEESQPIAEVVAPIPPEAPKEIPEEFTLDIDNDEDFQRAIKEIPADQINRFEEIIDPGDGDEMLEETVEAIVSKETEMDKVARRRAKQVLDNDYRESVGVNNTGLEYRNYSEKLVREVMGIRPNILFFYDEGDAVSREWEENLKQNSEQLEEVNALIIKVDYTEHTDLRARFEITKPGTALYFDPVGVTRGTYYNPSMSDLLDFFERFAIRS